MEVPEHLIADQKKLMTEILKLSKERDALQSRVKELEAELELRNINAEQFGDLSNCYDAEDVNRLVTRVFAELKDENARLRKVVEAARKFMASADSEPHEWFCSDRCAGLWYLKRKALAERAKVNNKGDKL